MYTTFLDRNLQFIKLTLGYTTKFFFMNSIRRASIRDFVSEFETNFQGHLKVKLFLFKRNSHILLHKMKEETISRVNWKLNILLNYCKINLETSEWRAIFQKEIFEHDIRYSILTRIATFWWILVCLKVFDSKILDVGVKFEAYWPRYRSVEIMYVL